MSDPHYPHQWNPRTSGNASPYPGYFPPLRPVPTTPKVVDVAKIALLTILWIALPLIPIGAAVYRFDTGSAGWYFLILAMLTPVVLGFGAVIPLIGLLIPNKAIRTIPIAYFWVIAVVHMTSVILWSMALVDEDDQDKLFSPLVSGAKNPEGLADDIAGYSAIAFLATYFAFIALAIVAHNRRRWL